MPDFETFLLALASIVLIVVAFAYGYIGPAADYTVAGVKMLKGGGGGER